MAKEPEVPNDLIDYPIYEDADWFIKPDEKENFEGITYSHIVRYFNAIILAIASTGALDIYAEKSGQTLDEIIDFHRLNVQGLKDLHMWHHKILGPDLEILKKVEQYAEQWRSENAGE